MTQNLTPIDYEKIVAEIIGISSDSRQIKPGFAFVAIGGEVIDGHDFIDDALRQGASYIIYEKNLALKGDNFIKVDNARHALALLASYFYKYQPDNIVAVTGTNGKSSTVSFYEQILNLSLKKAASIGTIGVSGFEAESCLTTPDPVTLYKLLATAKKKNIDYLAIEASSHGLKQNRLDAIKLKAAGFTNFTQDHLDYHLTFDDYFASKMLLFTNILKNGYAVINSDIPQYQKIQDICQQAGHKIIDFGRNAKYLKLLSITPKNSSQEFTYSISEKKYSCSVNLVGEFQIYNILCAIGFAIATGIDIETINNSIINLKCVSGRMEKANSHKEAYIDYSHTPDSLEKALLSLRPFVQNRLIVLFGCGGNRDKDKRPLMGEIAHKFADLIIVTDDNPRNEIPSEIRTQIITKCPNATEIEDRETAIKFALDNMVDGDILLIAGKGHENYQIIGDKKIHLSDKEIVEHYSANNSYNS